MTIFFKIRTTNGPKGSNYIFLSAEDKAEARKEAIEMLEEGERITGIEVASPEEFKNAMLSCFSGP